MISSELQYRAQFVCSTGCDFRAPLTEVIYRCPHCQGLLDVEQDLPALKRRSGTEWRAHFAQRYGDPTPPFNSGVWGKKEWVYPQLPISDIVTLGEGHAPLLPLPRTAQRLGLGQVLLKECGTSATGSFKDLGMTVLVSAVQHLRRIGKPIRAVTCASTGDTSAALSAFCARAGIPCVVFLPKSKISRSQLAQPIANGAHVLAIDSDFDGCMRIVEQATTGTGLYLANSMNPLRLEGQKTIAVELCQQLGWEPPDWVIVPGGNLGNASAIGRGFELMLALGLISRRPKIAVAQARNANPLLRAFKTGFADLSPITAAATQASAIQIGAPVSIHRAVKVLRAFDGVVEDASEDELADASARADREGAFTCPQTGVALAAMEKLAVAGTLGKGSTVVVISTAHGLKFPDFKEGYHSGSLAGVSSCHANTPVDLPADVSQVMRAIDARLDPAGAIR